MTKKKLFIVHHRWKCYSFSFRAFQAKLAWKQEKYQHFEIPNVIFNASENSYYLPIGF